MIPAFFGADVNILLRAFLAFWTALFIWLALGNRFINFIHKYQLAGQPIRNDGPKSHLKKKGTPNMGGILTLSATLISSLIFADLHNTYLWVCVFVIIAYGIAGFIDDYEKVTRNSSNAMSAKMKLLLQFSAAAISVGVISYTTNPDIRYTLQIPYLVDISINLGILYIPFAMVVIAGASNGVNLSDGLDGLASGLLIIAFGAFWAVAYFVGVDEACCFVNNVAGSQELLVVCAAVVGACLGFLWFNAPKARIFMGDTGSLALGALLGTIAIILKQEILLAIIGGVFVMETVSVFLQVFWFRRTGRRIFKMAPIHHHFEQLGWPETNVVIRFWIIGFMLAIFGIGSLFMGIGF